ncbi:hypothetical protein [Pseudaquabacterium pictum]|uniref:Uncharacterized protein n=1 Tax=Pseudaquabacterium pictum TaxID=2315236 RepID=A0A480AUQ3_9BURK|nr:hypothetical protein [Rubrivivax pictus]GCL65161.1 hypothetical protein AQPW35_42420 [Rubrivivax pictus]
MSASTELVLKEPRAVAPQLPLSNKPVAGHSGSISIEVLLDAPGEELRAEFDAINKKILALNSELEAFKRRRAWLLPQLGSSSKFMSESIAEELIRLEALIVSAESICADPMANSKHNELLLDSYKRKRERLLGSLKAQ